MKESFFENISTIETSIKKKQKPKGLLRLEELTSKMLTSDECELKLEING
jgi:hypothetical protein